MDISFEDNQMLTFHEFIMSNVELGSIKSILPVFEELLKGFLDVQLPTRQLIPAVRAVIRDLPRAMYHTVYTWLQYGIVPESNMCLVLARLIDYESRYQMDNFDRYVYELVELGSGHYLPICGRHHELGWRVHGTIVDTHDFSDLNEFIVMTSAEVLDLYGVGSVALEKLRQLLAKHDLKLYDD